MMKTEKCKEMMDRFLSGECSLEVMEHLTSCADCRDLAALDRMVTGSSVPMSVPESLDRAVLAHAAAKKRPVRKALSFRAFLRYAAVPVAAAVMLCFGLTFTSQTTVHPSKGPSSAKVNKSSVQYDWDSVDSELLLVSTQIEDVSAQLNRTVAYASLYDRNGVTR